MDSVARRLTFTDANDDEEEDRMAQSKIFPLKEHQIALERLESCKDSHVEEAQKQLEDPSEAEIVTGAKPEVQRVRADLSRLKFGFIQLETKQALLESTVRASASEKNWGAPDDKRKMKEEQAAEKAKSALRETKSRNTALANEMEHMAQQLIDACERNSTQRAECKALLESARCQMALDDDDAELPSTLEGIEQLAIAQKDEFARLGKETSVMEEETLATEEEELRLEEEIAQLEQECCQEKAPKNEFPEEKRRREMLEWYETMNETLTALGGVRMGSFGQNAFSLDVEEHTITIRLIPGTALPKAFEVTPADIPCSVLGRKAVEIGDIRFFVREFAGRARAAKLRAQELEHLGQRFLVHQEPGRENDSVIVSATLSGGVVCKMHVGSDYPAPYVRPVLASINGPSRVRTKLGAVKVRTIC